MMRSFAVAILSAAALAGCAQKPAAPPPAVAVAAPADTGFLPYCGPVWSVGRQGYVQIPCPAGVDHSGAR